MRRFILKCVQKTHPDIELPDLSPMTIGRNVQSQITNSRLSRKHLKLTANVEKKQVKCEVIGANSSRINESKILKKSDKAVLQSGDKIELLEGLFEYMVVLEKSESPRKTSMDPVPHLPPVQVHKNHWSQALYASMNDPELLVYKDDLLCVIKDKYPKSMNHFLVMPMEKMATLYDLEWPRHKDLLAEMEKAAKEQIIEKFPKSEFKMGFHAVPSMAQVHMHVISQDFLSPSLKNKKHWNSFNTEYFVPLDKVKQLLSKHGNLREAKVHSDKEELLKKDLICNQCDYKPKNLPDLKKHLEKHLKN